MRKVLFAAAMLIASIAANAQVNLQEQYDFNRKQLTTTLEMFKGDKWGSTFFFVDIYHKFDRAYPSDFYTEIARSLNFWKGSCLKDLSLHVEWNGGNGIYPTDLGTAGYSVNNAWLFGVEYFLHNADYSNTFTFELMYKRISGQKDLDKTPALLRPYGRVSDIPLQFTFVWGMNNLFGVKGLSFSGFLDVWGENANWGKTNKLEWDNTKLVALTEPQIWYNVGQHFGCDNLLVGGEVEMAYNFSGGWKSYPDNNKGFTVAPCLGLKWNF